MTDSSKTGDGRPYVVSAINRDLIRTATLVILGLALAVLALMIVLPNHYYFGVHHHSVTLYSVKIPGFMPIPVKGYENIPLDTDAARSLTERSFSNADEALAALKTFLTEQLKKQQEMITEKEKSLADAYRTYLPNLQGAVRIGIEDLDEQLKAIEGWVNYFRNKETAPKHD